MLKSIQVAFVAVAMAAAAASDTQAATAKFAWPVCGRVSSGFGTRTDPFTGRVVFHAGIDIVEARGTPVKASAGGRVLSAGEHGPDGLTVEIRHPGGFMTRYSKLDAIDVKPGQEVAQGEAIGKLGSTGLSTGPHLHFEIWHAGRAGNPRLYLRNAPHC